MARQWQRGEMTGLALVAGGFILVGMTFGGWYLGVLADRVFGTAPYGAVIGLVLGTLVGFWDLYLIAARIINSQPSSPSEGRESSPDDEQNNGT